MLENVVAWHKGCISLRVNDHEVFMEQPPGFMSKLFPNHVY